MQYVFKYELPFTPGVGSADDFTAFTNQTLYNLKLAFGRRQHFVLKYFRHNRQRIHTPAL